jgi:hypothetical protein
MMQDPIVVNDPGPGFVVSGRSELFLDERIIPKFEFKERDAFIVELYCRRKMGDPDTPLVLLDDILWSPPILGIDHVVSQYMQNQIDKRPKNPFMDTPLALWWIMHGYGLEYIDFMAKDMHTNLWYDGTAHVTYKNPL